MAGSSTCVSEALPPSIFRVWPETETLVPADHFTGCLPILDMASFLRLRSLPDRGEALAAHLARAALAVAEDAERRGVDADAHAVQHAPGIRDAAVHAAARRALAADLVDDVLAVGAVLELDGQAAGEAVGADAEVL